MAGPGAHAAQRTNVDDAAMRGTQGGDGLARHKERAARVGLEDVVPLIERDFVQRSAFEDGGVVDDEIDAAVKGKCGADHPADGIFGTHIAGERMRAAAEGLDRLHCEGGVGLGVSPSNGDVSAGPRQSQGDCTADAARASGDDSRFSLQWLGWHYDSFSASRPV